MEGSESDQENSDLQITIKYDATFFNKREIDHHDKLKKVAKKFKIQQSFGDLRYPSLTHKIYQRLIGNFQNSLLSNSYVSPSVFEMGLISDNNLTKHMDWALTLDKHDGCVNCINFNSYGDKLASGSDDLTIAIWNWGSEKLSTIFYSGHDLNVFQVKFVPNSNDSLLISCGNDGQIRLCDLNKNGIKPDEQVFTKKLGQHQGTSHKFVIGTGPDQNLDPSLILSCGEDGVVLQFDMRDFKPIKLVQVKSKHERRVPLYSITQHPFNPYEFAVSGRDPYVRIYDRRKVVGAGSHKLDSPVKKYCPHHLVLKDNSSMARGITSVTYNYTGSELLASYAYKAEAIFLFDTTHSDGADCVRRYKGLQNHATIKGVNFYGAKSEYVMSGSDCGHIFMWDKDSEEIVTVVKGDETGAVNCVEAHPRFPVIAASGLDNSVKILRPFLGETPLDELEIRRILNKNKKERSLNRNIVCAQEHGFSLFNAVNTFVTGLGSRRERLSTTRTTRSRTRPAANANAPNTNFSTESGSSSSMQEVGMYDLLSSQLNSYASPWSHDQDHVTHISQSDDDDDQWEDASSADQSDAAHDHYNQLEDASSDQSDAPNDDVALIGLVHAILNSPSPARIDEPLRRLPNGSEHRPRRFRTSRDTAYVVGSDRTELN